MQSKQKSILVVDDDPAFRQLLVQIFNANSYNVIEARSAQEAAGMMNAHIGLAIVDYRLPDEDGMTFISRVRERFSSLPIVFISGTFCDVKTFNWLRNILRVSLVLQKPIQPNLLLQQLEGLLPPRIVEQQTHVEEPQLTKEVLGVPESDYERLLLAAAGLSDVSSLDSDREEATSDDFNEFSRRKEADQDLFSHIEQMRKKLAVEAKISGAQTDLRKLMPPQWHALSENIARLQRDPKDTHSHKEATDIAHKLKGTAGSIGLSKVSVAAGRLEDYLKMLDPESETEHELLWGEIFRALAEGETGLNTADEPVPASMDENQNVSVQRALILGNEEKWTQSLIIAPVNVALVFANSATDAVLKASGGTFDTCIVDLEQCPKSTLPHITKAIRITSTNNNIPFAVVTTGDEKLEPIDANYIGISEQLLRPLDQVELTRTINRLTKTRSALQPRILTVDDDQVLTRFIQTILRADGMNVKALNEPIHVLEVAEDFEPELILLDVMMPGLSGYDVCRLLRAQQKWKSTPVIFLTSKSDAQGRAAAFSAGGNDFLSKPILSEELLKRVQNQLELAQPQRLATVLDDITGVLKTEVFRRRMQEEFLQAQKTNETFSLSLISIDNFEQLGKHGLFVELAAVAALGKLLSARFKSRALRGRWDENTFALAYRNEDNDDVKEALRLFTKEASQMPFTGDTGERFEINITTDTASYPLHAKSANALIDVASSELAEKNKSRTRISE